MAQPVIPDSPLPTGRTNLNAAFATIYADFAAADAALVPAIISSMFITTPTTYYVRTDGNDANTGLVNSPSGAFLTIQKALDTVVKKVLLAQVIIQVGDGAYTTGVILRSWAGNTPPYLRGNQTTPANCLISVSSGSCIALGPWNEASHQCQRNKWLIGGFKLLNSSGHGICVFGGSLDILGQMDFGAVSAGSHIVAAYDGTVRVHVGYSITGGAVGTAELCGSHIHASKGGSIEFTMAGPFTIFLSGTPNFNTAFAYALKTGKIEIKQSLHTFSGSATGSRCTASHLGMIDTNVGTSNYFPGSAADNILAPGVYY